MLAQCRRCARAGVLAGLVLCALAAGAAADQPSPALRIYGPGGPHEALSECAALYQELHGRMVVVHRGGPGALAQKVALDGDLYYGGAEYMLEDFDRRNPGVLDMQSVEMLHPRRIGIIVRKGNPLGITRIADLDRTGARVVKATLEQVSAFHAEPVRPDGSLHPQAYTGDDALKAWRSDSKIDAWITYRSWHGLLSAEADFIEIPDDGALRFTPIAITTRTHHRQEAERFIAFLKSPLARRIFREHGWE